MVVRLVKALCQVLALGVAPAPQAAANAAHGLQNVLVQWATSPARISQRAAFPLGACNNRDYEESFACGMVGRTSHLPTALAPAGRQPRLQRPPLPAGGRSL